MCILCPAPLRCSAFRPLAVDQQAFFRKMDFPVFASAALVVAFCQTLVYQGLWQDVFTSWLGGVRDPLLATSAVSDPRALMDPGQQPLMGTLVGGLRMPAFILAPSAAVLTAGLEAYWYYLALSLRDMTTT